MTINVPPLPAPSVPLVEPGTGLISSAWYIIIKSLYPAWIAGSTAIQDLPAVDPTLLHNNESDTLSKGFLSTPFDNGTKSSGTFTVDGANGALQKVTIAGKVTFGLPANGTSLQLLIIMATGAAVPDITAFEFIAGADIDAVVGNKFMASISNNSTYGTFSAIAGKGNT